MNNQSSQGGQKQQWWLSKQGKPVGPYDATFILEGLRSDKIPPETFACLVGGQTWKRLNESATFAGACPVATAPAASPLSSASPKGSQSRSVLRQPWLSYAGLLWGMYLFVCGIHHTMVMVAMISGRGDAGLCAMIFLLGALVLTCIGLVDKYVIHPDQEALSRPTLRLFAWFFGIAGLLPFVLSEVMKRH